MHGGHRFIDPIGLIALVLALLLVVASPSDAQADAAAAASPAGGELVRLPDEAFAFIPASVRQGRPAPLVVLLHGAGGRPADMIAPFRAEAEREGIVLVAPASRADSWDMIVGLREDSETARRTRAATGTAPRLVDDPPRVRAAMAEIGRRVAIDPRRVALAGFSDGASYALTLGPLNPRVFPVILAFSPGMAFLPKNMPGGSACSSPMAGRTGYCRSVMPRGTSSPTFAAPALPSPSVRSTAATSFPPRSAGKLSRSCSLRRPLRRPPELSRGRNGWLPGPLDMSALQRRSHAAPPGAGARKDYSI
jgi:predicted esterase